MTRIPLSAAALALALGAPALAQSAVADLAAIDRAVAQFTGMPQGAPGGAALPVDRRLRLTPCRAPLALGWYGARRDTVEVVCPMPGGWKLYVPLVGPADGGVAAAPLIARGDAVTITVSGDGFAVSQPGEALESGAEGAWIKVRGINPKAPVLRARVLRPGVVGIDLP
ncbi:MAG TPA: flagella basal body P-ring formation protein FlgA [Novosphingobium sp.]|nr:flagella basal body P-ring formation protein FlgA [Novosphingobium sp.]